MEGNSEVTKPLFIEGDKVEQLSDPGLVLTIKGSTWTGMCYRYSFKECYMECFEQYLKKTNS